NHRLLKYFTNGTNVTLLANTKVSSVCIDKFDNIYVTDVFGDEVKKLSSYDQSITTVAGSELNELRLDGQPGLYVDKNLTLYISDTGNDRVMKYFINSSSGIVVAGGHGAGAELNQLNSPYGIYVDEINEIGAIYICDHANHRIQKWIDGAHEGITVASNINQLRTPVSILLEPTADEMMMYILDFNHYRILKWIPYAQEPEAIAVGITGHLGNEPNQLSSPRGIKFDKNWNLFVADTGNNRIQKFLFNSSSCENNN
ncbi:unnamed protein product, partial [Rotaria sp. Silwood1]